MEDAEDGKVGVGTGLRMVTAAASEAAGGVVGGSIGAGAAFDFVEDGMNRYAASEVAGAIFGAAFGQDARGANENSSDILIENTPQFLENDQRSGVFKCKESK